MWSYRCQPCEAGNYGYVLGKKNTYRASLAGSTTVLLILGVWLPWQQKVKACGSCLLNINNLRCSEQKLLPTGKTSSACSYVYHVTSVLVSWACCSLLISLIRANRKCLKWINLKLFRCSQKTIFMQLLSWTYTVSCRCCWSFIF